VRPHTGPEGAFGGAFSGRALKKSAKFAKKFAKPPSIFREKGIK